MGLPMEACVFIFPPSENLPVPIPKKVHPKYLFMVLQPTYGCHFFPPARDRRLDAGGCSKLEQPLVLSTEKGLPQSLLYILMTLTPLAYSSWVNVTVCPCQRLLARSASSTLGVWLHLRSACGPPRLTAVASWLGDAPRLHTICMVRQLVWCHSFHHTRILSTGQRDVDSPARSDTIRSRYSDRRADMAIVLTVMAICWIASTRAEGVPYRDRL
jgi:hypothetical protein